MFIDSSTVFTTATMGPLHVGITAAVRILRKNAEKYFVEKREQRSIYVSCRHSCMAPQ